MALVTQTRLQQRRDGCQEQLRGAPSCSSSQPAADAKSELYPCQMCHKALSVPRTNTSRRPSALRPTAILLVSTPPRDDQPDQPLFGATCHLCQRALSVPRTNTSSRPSAFCPTTGSLVRMPPSESQSDQPLFGATCHLCQRALSVPRTNTSSRPSAFLSTAILLVRMPPLREPVGPAIIWRHLPLVPEGVVGAPYEHLQPTIFVVGYGWVAGEHATFRCPARPAGSLRAD